MCVCPTKPGSGANAEKEEHLWKWHVLNAHKCVPLGKEFTLNVVGLLNNVSVDICLHHIHTALQLLCYRNCIAMYAAVIPPCVSCRYGMRGLWRMGSRNVALSGISPNSSCTTTANLWAVCLNPMAECCGAFLIAWEEWGEGEVYQYHTWAQTFCTLLTPCHYL